MPIDNSNKLLTGKPGLFTPSLVRSMKSPSNNSVYYTLATIDPELTTDVTESFKYTTPGTGLRSTQQLNIDWSKFENHTFFNSAQVKLNVAFDKIQNGFPFDGTQKETDTFLDSLTGFEKYVYDYYPKNVGYLFFSGTNAGYEAAGGTYITVLDQAGAQYTEASRNRDGSSILNFKNDPLTIEYWLYVPTKANANQVILDRHSGSFGYLFGLNSTTSTAYATSSFYIASGSVSETVSAIAEKGTWNHYAWVLNRTPGFNGITCFINGKLYTSSSAPIELDTMDFAANLYIGSGSVFSSVGFTPTNTLSGALDELRIWSSVRSKDDIYQLYKKSVFAQEDLKLYYKFNEPSGSNSLIVIDASSNSLHGRLSLAGQTLGVRNIATGSYFGSTPVVYETVSLSPILFGNHPEVLAYRNEYALSASQYDEFNPNLITRLIPKHYFYEGQVEAALETEQGAIVNQYQAGNDPRSTKLGATQTFLLLLYTWAKFFDEIKLYIQSFVDLQFVDYDEIDTAPEQFLLQYASSMGFDLPALFSGATIPQFVEGDNVQDVISKNQYSLRYIKNQIWRRILINLKDIVNSKGTIHSIKSFIRSVGIDPDNNFRIREYGGPTKLALGFARDTRSKISSKLSFNNGGQIISPYLSGARVEPGYPNIAGAANDGLFTSGSWTYEGFYKFGNNVAYPMSQSLIRFVTTGSAYTVSGGVISNLIAYSGSLTNEISLYVRPNDNNLSPYFKLSLTGANIFDGDLWYVSFGRRRNDDGLDSVVSSSYFLRVAKNVSGELAESYITQSYFNETSGSGNNVWSTKPTLYNASGSYFIVGSSSINTTVSRFLNDTSIPSDAQTTIFKGNISHIRFWSKYLNDQEWKEHVKNYQSAGVQHPLTNFNFITYKSGSFERLRIDATTEQMITQSDGAGLINIFDFSQNNFHLSGALFPTSSQVINPERIFFSYLSPHFDEASTNNKVRIRSYEQSEELTNAPWAKITPAYEIPKSEIPTDNSKFTVDFSLVDALNQDIVTIFATFDELDNVLGNPELVFSQDYPGLDNLRNIYFNRLVDKVNFKQFVEFFKWFDTNIGTFIHQLIPKKTKFLGTNFVVESHMLERPKFQYQFEDIYLGDSNRNGLKDTILLSFFAGDFVRY
jgi:hypothetical protein